MLACQQQLTLEQQISQEMEALETVELQVAYLEQLYEWDQQVRHTVDEQIQTYGFNSPEHLQAAQDMVAVDNLNQAKLEAFFAAYGHPKLAIHGKSACGIPWIDSCSVKIALLAPEEADKS